MMKTNSYLLSIVGLCLSNSATRTAAFVPKHAVLLGKTKRTSSSSNDIFVARAMDAGMIAEMETARAAFVLCFAGAIGSAAVGREVIPVTWREYQKLNELKGQGQSLKAGDELDLFGYPEPVYADDVMAIINNNMTVYDIVNAYPVEGQLPGYLRFESMAKANADKSQVAVRALFDSIAIGVNKNSVAPSVAAEKFELYKSDLDLMMSNSRLNKTIGVVALIFLLSLIGSADYFALFHLFHGWFPEWQGTSGLPLSLFDFKLYTSLPSCFMNDVPPIPIASGAFPMN